MPDWLREPTPAADDTPDWLHTTSDATPAADDTPDWLHTTSDATPAADDTPDWPRPAESARPNDDPSPDWLRDVAGTPPAAPPTTDDTPDWLRPAESARPNDDPSPDWLHPTTDEPAAPRGDDGPDWLRPTSEASALDDVDVKPFSLDMIGEAPITASAEPTAPPAPPAGPPSWLSAPDDDDDSAPPWLSTTTGPSAAPEDDAPAWLRAAAPDDRPAAPAAPSNDIPDWLRSDDQSAPVDAPPWLQDSKPAQDASTPAPGDIPAWLQDPTPTQQPSSPSDIPAWLQDPTPTQQPGAPPAADIPPWLQDTTPAEETSAPAPEPRGAPSNIPPWLQDAAPAQAAADLPDWLREEASAPPASPPTSPGAGQELPDWLRADLPDSPAPDTAAGLPGWLRDEPPAAAPPAATIPDWLQEPAPDGPPAIAPVAIPDWLREDDPSPPAAPPPTAGEAPAALPAWLTSDLAAAEPAATQDIPPWLRDERGQPLPTAVAPGEAGLPEWLRGAPAEARVTPSPPAPPSDVDAPTRPGVGWFDEEDAPAPAPDSGLLGGTELPAWLKVETEARPDAGAVDTRSIDWLTRLGVQEEEPAAAPAPMQRVAPPRAPARSAAQLEAAALLRRLAANPLPDVAPVPAEERGGILRRIGLERALSLILLVGLVVALAVPSLSAGLRAAPTAPGAAELSQQIDQLGEDDIVLVGYEWDSRRAGELRPLEQAVIGHLIERQVKLVLVSTDPQGTLLLFDLRDQLTAAGYAQNGEGYLLLGYKPGGELALRGMAQNFQSTLRSDFDGDDATISVLVKGLETGRPLNTLRDFSMIVVMADDTPDVQAWMEQIRPATDATIDAPGIPMAFLLPSEAAPIIQPYVVQRDVHHLAGQSGALAYRAQNGTADEQVAVQTGQLRLSALIFVGLLLAGAVAAVVVAAVERRRGTT